MTETTVKKFGGLLPLPADARDFSFSKVLGSIPVDDLPIGDFFVDEPLGIKDQGGTDFCAGYAGAAVKEDQEMVLLNPEYTWVQAKKALGGDSWKQWGLNLRDLCLAGVNKGWIEQEMYPFQNQEEERDYIANPANWSEELDMFAAEHRAASFFTVDGPHDRFDNYRSAMYKNRTKRCSIITGAMWRPSWTQSTNGVISRNGWQDEAGEGHAFKIFGQIMLDDVDNPGQKSIYLAAQLSNGIDIGDAGVYYFPREIINSEFNFGKYMFTDVPKDIAQIHHENDLALDDPRFKKFWTILFNFIIRLFKKS